MHKTAADMEYLAAQPLRLPCGLVLKHRIVKTAMSEKMAGADAAPSPAHARLYGEWAQGGWSALITGNIMVDDRYLAGFGDVALPWSPRSQLPAQVVDKWRAWTNAAAGHGCHMIAQLNHPGRQSPMGAGNRGWFSKTIAPSALPLDIGSSWLATLVRSVLFGVPQAMTRYDIDDVVARFASAAKLAVEMGFQGVEIQAGHGFLLSQFLSPTSNRRSDEFGGDAAARAELVLHILAAVRAAVPDAGFCVGIKINTADVADHDAMRDLLVQIGLIVAKGHIDYIHLTGGTYEDPRMYSGNPSTEPHGSSDAAAGTASTTTTTTSKPPTRQAFFLSCSHAVRAAFPDLVLLLTGGFRSKAAVDAALDTGACSAVGFGRPAIKYPDLPNRMLLQDETDFEIEVAPSPPRWIATAIRSVGAGAESRYWAARMRSIAR